MMDKRDAREAAQRAAAKIEAYLSGYQAEFRTRVYGDPPTISLQLSVGAAHYLLDAIQR